MPSVQADKKQWPAQDDGLRRAAGSPSNIHLCVLEVLLRALRYWTISSSSALASSTPFTSAKRVLLSVLILGSVLEPRTPLVKLRSSMRAPTHERNTKVAPRVRTVRHI